MTHTIDANVFVSAFIQTEAQHADSITYLASVVRQSIDVICPTLFLTESAAGIFRPTGEFALARQCLQQISLFPGLTFVSLTEDRARQAAQMAMAHRLRGADAIYVAAAVEFGATLVTWDSEILQRGAQAVTALSPTQWLAIPLPTSGEQKQ